MLVRGITFVVLLVSSSLFLHARSHAEFLFNHKPPPEKPKSGEVSRQAGSDLYAVLSDLFKALSVLEGKEDEVQANKIISGAHAAVGEIRGRYEEIATMEDVVTDARQVSIDLVAAHDPEAAKFVKDVFEFYKISFPTSAPEVMQIAVDEVSGFETFLSKLKFSGKEGDRKLVLSLYDALSRLLYIGLADPEFTSAAEE